MEATTAAIVGVVASKFVSKAWDSGEKWLKSFYQDHSPQAIEEAKQNSNDFLYKLALKVDQLEQDSKINKTIFENALNEPHFGVLLQKALIGSSQTKNQEKHEILASLVSQRLKAEPDSIYIVASQMACDAITNCTTSQLHILAFYVSLNCVRPNFTKQIFSSEESFISVCKSWFEDRLSLFSELKINPLDLSHLESLSCLKFDFLIQTNLNKSLETRWQFENYTLKQNHLLGFSIGPIVQSVWENQKLKNASLTTVGQMIGSFTADILCGGPSTSFEEWQKQR